MLPAAYPQVFRGEGGHVGDREPSRRRGNVITRGERG